MAKKAEEKEEPKGGVQTKALDKVIGSDGARLELVRRRLEKVDDDDPELPKLIAERRRLEKAREIRRLERKLEMLRGGDVDDDDCFPW